MSIDVTEAVANLLRIEHAQTKYDFWYERYCHAATMLDQSRREKCDYTRASRGEPRCVRCPSSMCRNDYDKEPKS